MLLIEYIYVSEKNHYINSGQKIMINQFFYVYAFDFLRLRLTNDKQTFFYFIYMTKHLLIFNKKNKRKKLEVFIF